MQLTCQLCNRESLFDPKIIKEEMATSIFKDHIICNKCNLGKVKYLIELLEHANSNQSEKTMALLIKEKPSEVITLIKPKKKYFQLEELQQSVDGLIELVTWKLKDYVIVVNEEGSYKKNLNETASQLFNMTLFGDVLICPEEIFEAPEEDDEDA